MTLYMRLCCAAVLFDVVYDKELELQVMSTCTCT